MSLSMPSSFRACSCWSIFTSPSAYPELNDTTVDDVVEPFPSPEVNGQTIEAGAAVQRVPFVDEVGPERARRRAQLRPRPRRRDARVLQRLADGAAGGVPAAARVGGDHHLQRHASGVGCLGQGADGGEGSEGFQEGITAHACLQCGCCWAGMLAGDPVNRLSNALG